MIATASVPIHLGGRRQAASGNVTQGEHPRAPGRRGIVTVIRPALGWRWRTALMDSVTLAAVALSVPLVVLMVGTPIALAVVVLLWSGRLALSAF